MKLNFFLVILIFLELTPKTFAQLSQDFGPPGKQKARVFYKLQAHQYNALLFVPVYQAEDTTYGLTAKADHFKVDRNDKSSNFVSVEELASYQYGFGWSHAEEDKSTWAVTGSYGSASDKPFDGADVSAFDATLIRKFETSPTTSWTLFLNYSNNRSILNNIPLPGFAYTFTNQNKTSGGAIGLPFFSYWVRPTEKFFASAVIFIPSFMQVQAGYMIWGPFQGVAKYEFIHQNYFRSGRANKDEQIFYEYSRAATGLKGYLSASTFLELEYAHVFSRSLYDGKSAYEITSDRMTLPNDWQLAATLQVGF
jgi:hypothetical protein